MKQPTYPFITREMLDFEQGVTFSLIVDIRSRNSQDIRITGYTKSGPFVFSYTTGTGITLETATFPLVDIPISISVDVDQGTNWRGSIYARAYLGLNGTRHMTLMSGYLSVIESLSWPYTNDDDSLSGMGERRSIAGTNPAANTEIQESPISEVNWKLHAVSFTLVTDANAANRQVSLSLGWGGSDQIIIPAPAVQIASKTIFYTFGVGLPHFNDTVGLRMTAPIPPGLHFNDSDNIATLTTNLQATDNYGAPTLVVEQFLTGA